MAESPRSERYHTRFSTPEPDLDDHRGQAGSLPRAATFSAGNQGNARRGTVTSVHTIERPDLRVQLSEALERHGMTAIDFENAIDDDNREIAELQGVRRGSLISPISPISQSGRRNTFQRPRDHEDEQKNRSRTSSTSSRSVSPPNSVDAFADRRRRGRAGTVESKCPSDLDLALKRTTSVGTHQRRPTFTDDVKTDKESIKSRDSRLSDAEEDVCFPVQDVGGKQSRFDFDELEEFITEEQEKTLIDHPLRRKASLATLSSKRKIFSDLRPASVSSRPDTPNLPVSGSDTQIDEKDEMMMGQAKPASIAEMPQNRWTFFSSELDDSIHTAELAGLLMPGETFEDLFQLPPDGGVWWLDMLDPTEEEVTAVCKAFRVHPLTREDITTQEAREKVELFNQYYFVCFRSFYQVDKSSEDYLEPVNVYAIVFKEGLLTFSFCNNPHAANVRQRISKLRDYVTLTADWICYALIDDIVDSFGPVIREVEYETDAIEDQVFTARAEDSRQILLTIGKCRKKVMQLLRLLGGKADVIKGFAKRCTERFEVAPRGDVGIYLSDIQDHVVTMMSNLGHFEKMLSRSHSNYLAQISVDNLTQGNTVNETLGKVTVIATILVPLNLICGLFGMNVTVPGQHSDSLAWFFGILGVIILFVCSCLGVAKRLRFI